MGVKKAAQGGELKLFEKFSAEFSGGSLCGCNQPQPVQILNFPVKNIGTLI